MNVGLIMVFVCLFLRQQTQALSTTMVDDSLKDVIIKSDINANEEFVFGKDKGKGIYVDRTRKKENV